MRILSTGLQATRSFPPRGRIELDSPEGRRAIETSLRALTPQGSFLLPMGAAELSAQSVERDELAMVHVRLDRTHQGLPVIGEQVITHLDAAGKVVNVTGDAFAPITVDMTPRLTAREAVAAARRTPAQATFGAIALQDEVQTRPVILNDDALGYRLAFEVVATNLESDRPYRQKTYVDAQTGAVLRSYNSLPTTVAQGAAPISGEASAPPSPTEAALTPGTGRSLYSGVVELSTQANADGSFSLIDPTRGGSRTKDAQHYGSASLWDPVRDKNNIWGEEKEGHNVRAAIDAHYAMQMVWDFVRDVVGRNSFDDRGTRITSAVHINRNFMNAYWNGAGINYGDGDGVHLNEWTTIDIGGHEFGHGITENTSKLELVGEAGGLNESMSDIYGAAAERYAAQKNPNLSWNYDMGEAAVTERYRGRALRHMSDPQKDNVSIDHYSAITPTTEIHLSSGISNNAFYLLAEGGTNRTSGARVEQGIGFDDAFKIFNRANTVYFRPTTNFRQAREACIQAATDLFGAESLQVKTVEAAWAAVGVAPTAPSA
jgi:Zn-dependent metalloprotease